MFGKQLEKQNFFVWGLGGSTASTKCSICSLVCVLIQSSMIPCKSLMNDWAMAMAFQIFAPAAS